MQTRENTGYSALASDVAEELTHAADAAMAAGVNAWQLMLDPGIGFAKTAADSAALLTLLPAIRTHLPGVPLLPHQKCV